MALELESLAPGEIFPSITLRNSGGNTYDWNYYLQPFSHWLFFYGEDFDDMMIFRQGMRNALGRRNLNYDSRKKGNIVELWIYGVRNG